MNLRIKHIGIACFLLVLIFLSCNTSEKPRVSVLPVSLRSTENRIYNSYFNYIEKVNKPGCALSPFYTKNEIHSDNQFSNEIVANPDLLFYTATLWQVYKLRELYSFQKSAIDYTKAIQTSDSGVNLLDGEIIESVFLTPYKLHNNKKYAEFTVEMISKYILELERESNFALNFGKLPKRNVDLLLGNEVLFFASKETGDPVFRNIALENSSGLYETYFRNDSRIGAVLKNDLTSQKVNRLRNEDFYTLSVGLCGFLELYEETGMIEYLQFSKNIASLFMVLFDSENNKLEVELKESVKSKINLLTRSLVCLALFDLSEYGDESLAEISSDIYENMLHELELQTKETQGLNENQDNKNCSFRLFYYLLEYELRKQNLV